MALEIERKFLLAQPISAWEVDRIATAAGAITQGYLTEPDADVEVRLRRARALSLDSAGQVAPSAAEESGEVVIRQWLAVKSNVRMRREEGGFSRHELEVEITPKQFDETWPLVGPRVLRKIRTSVAVRDAARGFYEVSVDTFSGRLEGLTLAELEFVSWAESVSFRPPGFLGDEVTHDRRYRNANLASMTTPPYL